jgi:hypothetical protein
MSTTDDRLRELAPIGADEVRALALDGESDLCRAIVATPRRGRRPLGRLGGLGAPSPRGRLPLAAVVASAALVALALGGLAAIVAGSGGGTPGAPAAGPGTTVQGTVVERSSELERTRAQLPKTLSSTTAVAPSATLPAATVPASKVPPPPTAVPLRYLPAEPGWTVTRADEYGREGEMTIEKGGVALELYWRVGALSKLVRDREDSADRIANAQVGGGAPVTLLRSRDLRDWFIALWPSGGRTMELRPQGLPGDMRLGEERFRALLGALRPVSKGEWEAALPSGTVLPARRAAVARAMLAGVPLPPGFAVDRLAAGDQVNDRYQYGAQVVGAVACAWIDRWAQARRAGDRAQQRAAVEAMATARSWATLREMARQGAYPDVLWDFAAAMRGDGRIHGGKGADVEQAAPAGLGCADR